MTSLKRIEHFAGLARNSRGVRKEAALREMKLAILDFLRDERAEMLCGHPRSAIVSSDEGTNYCSECEREA